MVGKDWLYVDDAALCHDLETDKLTANESSLRKPGAVHITIIFIILNN